jgi:septum formation protein
MDILLASTSPYRRALLQRLQLSFRCIDPATDETPLAGEAPAERAKRLALKKARAVSATEPEALVIGSDQVAACAGRILGKPGHLDAARQQLQACSGRDVVFYTAVALVAPDGGARLHLEPTTVRFRQLTGATIEDYLRREEPYDCAGSFKVEQLGIALFERVSSGDPTALEGLPLIALCRLLREAGVHVLQV